jgi:hypothetical protein
MTPSRRVERPRPIPVQSSVLLPPHSTSAANAGALRAASRASAEAAGGPSRWAEIVWQTEDGALSSLSPFGYPARPRRRWVRGTAAIGSDQDGEARGGVLGGLAGAARMCGLVAVIPAFSATARKVRPKPASRSVAGPSYECGRGCGLLRSLRPTSLPCSRLPRDALGTAAHLFGRRSPDCLVRRQTSLRDPDPTVVACSGDWARATDSRLGFRSKSQSSRHGSISMITLEVSVIEVHVSYQCTIEFHVQT